MPSTEETFWVDTSAPTTLLSRAPRRGCGTRVARPGLVRQSTHGRRNTPIRALAHSRAATLAGMTTTESTGLELLAREALAIRDVQSVAVFSVAPSGVLELAAAAGIEGAPLAGLVTAVQQPGHPVARAVGDPGPTFDVKPVNPGGPALRAHLPLRDRDDRSRALGVLALAYDRPFDRAERERAVLLADRLAGLLTQP